MQDTWNVLKIKFSNDPSQACSVLTLCCTLQELKPTPSLLMFLEINFLILCSLCMSIWIYILWYWTKYSLTYPKVDNICIAFVINIIWVCIYIEHHLVWCRIWGKYNMNHTWVLYKNKVGVFNYFLQWNFST
jgi:hypothetical protein